jgi:Tol biopolymer transport system component
MTFHRTCLVVAATVGIVGSPLVLRGQRPSDVAPRPSFAEPAVSPDGFEIAVVSGGDVWTVPASGGEARLLVAHPAAESRPLFSPSGDRLAFISDRSGDGDIFILTLASGDVRQITFDDGLERLDAWSRDGQWIYFSSTAGDVAGMNDVYRVRASGGTPIAVSGDRYTSEYFGAPSPDGSRLAFVARGNSAGQWWRNGRSHLDESELWVRSQTGAPAYERLTPRGAKQGWPMWSPDGRRLFFVSDRSGAQNLWSMDVGGDARQMTRFSNGRVLWPSMSADGRTIVYERDFEVWKFDTASGQTSQIAITRRGTPAVPAIERVTLNTQLQDLSLSPDGRKVLFVARGELWAAASREGGDAFRVTRSIGRELTPTWTPDSRRAVYASERDGNTNLFVYDFGSSTESQLTKASGIDSGPRVSPDGTLVAFVRDGKEVRSVELESRQERLLATGHVSRSSRALSWSPDSKWLAYLGLTGVSFRNAFVVSGTGGPSRAVTALPNGNANSLTWSPDGTFLLFTTSQRTEDGQVARVDLILRTPPFREDRFRDLFRDEPARTQSPDRRTEKPAEPAATTTSTAARRETPAPVDIVFDDIRRRLRTLPVGVDVTSQSISPDGKSLLLTAAAEGQQNLYVYSLDETSAEPPVARQLTSSSGNKADAQFSPDGKDVFYLEQGRLSVMPVDTRQARSVAIAVEMDVDFGTEKMEVFREAWTGLRDGFYDEAFHGVDWNAVRTRYAPRVAAALTPAEMRRLLNLMVGELNSSHMGVGAPPGRGDGPRVGRLGLRFDRAEFEQNGRLKVTEVVPLGPAAITRQVAVGDYVTAVDGQAIGAASSLDELLLHTVNRRVVLTMSSAATGATSREVAVRPISQATEKNLLYRQWVEQNRAYVDRISGGRLGYVHMNDMSDGALTRLYGDLDADNRSKAGVVVDVRNNNGGFVNVYAIDVLARRGYLLMTPRGLPTAPARSVLGQRALELPTILVTNQHSLSDAEDFTEGYRTLKLGKVVGEPTSGWIIYTGNQTLIDGTTIRMPSTRITSLDGKTMELVPRPVDIPVTRPIGEAQTGKDSQLDAAVRALLAQLGSTTTTAQPQSRR